MEQTMLGRSTGHQQFASSMLKGWTLPQGDRAQMGEQEWECRREPQTEEATKEGGALILKAGEAAAEDSALELSHS